MILDDQPLVKSLFCLTKQSPNEFFDFEASIPLKLDIIFLGGGVGGPPDPPRGLPPAVSWGGRVVGVQNRGPPPVWRPLLLMAFRILHDVFCEGN